VVHQEVQLVVRSQVVLIISHIMICLELAKMTTLTKSKKRIEKKLLRSIQIKVEMSKNSRKSKKLMIL
jgi:hypothetical protein